LDAFAAVITCKKAELLMDRKAFGGNVGGRGIEDFGFGSGGGGGGIAKSVAQF
jgi:hypothetical protein